MFLGYAKKSNAFRFIDLDSLKIVISRDVNFDESSTRRNVPSMIRESDESQHGNSATLDIKVCALDNHNTQSEAM